MSNKAFLIITTQECYWNGGNNPTYYTLLTGDKSCSEKRQ